MAGRTGRRGDERGGYRECRGSLGGRGRGRLRRRATGDPAVSADGASASPRRCGSGRTAVGDPRRGRVLFQGRKRGARVAEPARRNRSEEHTSELQSLMRISYAVFCLKKKNNTTNKRAKYIKSDT